MRLPGAIAAEAGPLRLHPYQRAIADAIADPKVERVSVLKSAPIGFTTCLVGAIAPIRKLLSEATRMVPYHMAGSYQTGAAPSSGR